MSGTHGVTPQDLGPQHRLLEPQLAVELLDRIWLGVHIEHGVDALGVLLDLEREAALAPDLDLLDVPARSADDVEKAVQRGLNRALVESGIEDDHNLVM